MGWIKSVYNAYPPPGLGTVFGKIQLAAVAEPDIWPVTVGKTAVLLVTFLSRSTRKKLIKSMFRLIENGANM